MTATTIPTTTVDQARPARPTVAKAGLLAGAAAAIATTAVAAAARALDVPLTVGGEAIPVLGFGQVTLVCTLVGALLARSLGRRARSPRRTFVRTTVVLTALSLVPDLTAQATTATRATLVLTHLVAAALVIPALARCLPLQRVAA
ncbi:hypothetical protein KSP35_14695 [Aquihabitans sp. G128]|uniref:DUF6069 family protein n=1 Tax=Aquihabitans sp. G128 TaxID=2849779 RepID=UPI001C226AD1|nr:DUF6069 family protein [Aquihabitans sp. G128]QXC59629.1 hypothetical protein KSP35_14695 [Aquihabitans sp. G128]